MHASHIEGQNILKSRLKIEVLEKHATNENFIYRHRWRDGDLLMWDNRCLFHNAVNDYHGHRRHMHRVIIRGERPE